jgi:peptidoglycan/LPS O-acetylase OafA/YrhL
VAGQTRQTCPYKAALGACIEGLSNKALLMHPGSRRIPELDGLRGAAIALVLLFHFVLSIQTPWPDLNRVMLFGWSGVDLFFVLSGFLIGGILLDYRSSDSYFTAFYARRFFRIVPIYFAVLALYGLVWLFGGNSRAHENLYVGPPMSWYAYVTFTNNFWIALHNSMKIFLPPSWSLAIEEQFYLTLPLIIFLVRPKHVAKIVFTGIAAILALRWFYCSHALVSQNQAYVLPWFRADALLIGVSAALTVRNARALTWLKSHLWTLYLAAAVFAALVIHTGGALPADEASPNHPVMTYGLTCVALMYACILLAAVLGRSRIQSRLLTLSPLRWLGKVSYCVYLIHVPIFSAMFHSFGVRVPVALVALASMFVLAELSWRVFEAPLMRIGHRFNYSEHRTPDQPLPLTEPEPASAA